MNFVISGTASGLGRYLHENLGGAGLTRQTSGEELEKLQKNGADIIIHCAFNSGTGINSDTLYPYFEDNVLLTKELVAIPHKKFIFISSIAVYPESPKFHAEDEVIDMDSVKGVYGVTKLMSESIVKKYCRNYIILRSTTPLGKYSRKNTLLKIIEDAECSVGLSADSRFNYVLYSDIRDFIKLSIEKDLQGIYNVASSGNMVLSEVADIVGKSVHFGSHGYDAGDIDNRKINAVFPAFKKSSKEALKYFLEEMRQ